MTDNELLQLSHLDTLLAQTTHIDEITTIRAKLEALRVYAVNIGASRDKCQEIAMARIKAERKAGQVMLSLPKRNGARPADVGFMDTNPQDIDGVLPSQRNSWQTIAKLPDDVFERVMLERYQSGDDITTTYFYRAARIHIGRTNNTYRHTPQSIAAIAHEHLNAEQISQLIEILRGRML